MAETKTYGYVRVSSFGQNVERQLADVACDRIFTDHASGKNRERPQLTALLSHLRDDDTLEA